jgi:hypothetical protein
MAAIPARKSLARPLPPVAADVSVSSCGQSEMRPTTSSVWSVSGDHIVYSRHVDGILRRHLAIAKKHSEISAYIGNPDHSAENHRSDPMGSWGS